MERRRTLRLLEVALSLLLVVSLSASTPAVRVEGKVTSTGDAVPGVTVEPVSEIDWKAASARYTDEHGYYLLLLQPGSYTITFSLAGLGRETRSRVIVEVGAPVKLDVELSVAVRETI